MVDTPIYDQLAAEFAEADKYHGLGFIPPETVALSAYDDTTVMQAVTDEGEPVEAAEEPTEGVEKEEADEPPSILDEAPKSAMALAALFDKIRFLQAKAPENPVSEDNHVFPIRRYPEDGFNFFQTAQIFDKRAA